MKKSLLAIGVFTIIFFIGFAYFGKSKANSKKVSVNPEFKEYISAFTSGYLMANSKIKIVLQSKNENANQLNKEQENTLFKFSPKIKGNMVWLDESTLEFRPTEKLKHNQDYEVTFLLGEIVGVKSDLKKFNFNFQTIPQSLEIKITDFSVVSNGINVGGILNTADECDNSKLEKCLEANFEGETKKIIWVHENINTHHFTIEKVERSSAANTTLKIEFKGKGIDAKEEGVEIIEIPVKDKFCVMKIIEENGSDQQATIFFSNNLSRSTNINGLFELEQSNLANYLINGNKLTLFPTTRLNGSKSLKLSDEIADDNEKKLSGQKIFYLNFEELKPEIRFNGKGTIMPGTDKLLLPFEAVNLNAVDIKIKKIYEKNILQFFQINAMSGSNELNRVGKIIYKQRVSLTSLGELSQNNWQKYSIDLSKLIKTEPGAIYNVTLSFKKDYSIYNCNGDTSTTNLEYNYSNNSSSKDDESNTITENEDDWDNYNEYEEDYDYEERYDYSQRENPCSPSYYVYGKSISKNVLATNTSILAKRGNNGSITVMAADIISAQPIGNVELEVYDFQQTLIEKALTDISGIAQFHFKSKPFAIIAKNGKERTYLKLDDGSSLSLSMFDVEGEQIKKGLKGFIYGERGIWRPGDSLYLTFILENREKKIPAIFPVNMEIINPQGQVIQKITRTKNLDGFYNFSTKTETYAQTGTYVARIKAGGAVFTKNLRIETIMPNRLKLSLDFKTELLHSYTPLIGALQINWLHGAPGRNLGTKIDLLLTQGKTEFKNFKEYVFDNPSAYTQVEPTTIFTGKTNEDGLVKVSTNLTSIQNAPGFMNANFTVRGFEEGGAFSTDRFTLPISPYKEYVGLKIPKPDPSIGYLYSGENHEFNVVNVNEEGKTVSGNIEVSVYKVNWRWWWDNYSDDFSSYLSGEYNSPIKTEKIILQNGIGKFNLKIDQSEWGRYLVIAKNLVSGHTTGSVVFLDWPSWAGKSPKGNEGANFLSVSTDKVEYNLKEMVRIHFPSAQGTKAFITVENGSRVIKSFWASTNKDSTDAWLEITEDMTPNIYIYVTLIQPHQQTINDLPIRLYGVASIKVTDPTKILKPIISTSETWRPESEAIVKISENNGKEFTYTLAVVDDGILDLTRFKTPDAYNAFYSKEALGVKTWDIFDEVMGATSGGIQRILSIGGDQGLDTKQGPNAQRFKPMVRYIGPFHLNAGETNTHKINVPQYVGSVRVMCVAGIDNAYGSSEKTIPVRKPLMILSTLPRVLGPGEEVDLPVTVFAMENKVKNAKITIDADNNFILPYENSQTIQFEKIGDKVITFRLKVKETTGWAKVKIRAEGGGETCTETINIELRSSNPKMTEVSEATLEAGKSFSLDYIKLGITGTNSGAVEISSIPALNLEQRLNYLIEYPHGCIEQTTSSVFASIYLSDLIDLDANQKKNIETNTKAAISKIKSFQISSGGFSYWPGSNNSDDWGTNYAGHFLIEAAKKGYVIPFGLMDGWKKYQKEKALQWQGTKTAIKYQEDLTQAYRLYTLALANSPELGAMNRMKENKNLSVAAKWRLAAAYFYAGHQETARSIINNLQTKIENYNELNYTYGSPERDEAMILETLTLLNEKKKGFEILKKVATALASLNWMSTQSTAYCLISASKYLKENKAGIGINAECKIGKNSSLIGTKQSIHKVKIENADKSTKITIKNNSNTILFVRITRRGVPVTGNEKESSNNMNMSIVYKKLTGEIIDVSRLQQGTDFVAEITILNTGLKGNLNNLALTQIFPGGWEIHNTRLDDNAQLFSKIDAPMYQDIRDDRIYSYYELKNNSKKTFRVILNASYIGKYYLPGTKTEAMYDNSIYANKAGMWVEVVKSGNSL